MKRILGSLRVEFAFGRKKRRRRRQLVRALKIAGAAQGAATVAGMGYVAAYLLKGRQNQESSSQGIQTASSSASPTPIRARGVPVRLAEMNPYRKRKAVAAYQSRVAKATTLNVGKETGNSLAYREAKGMGANRYQLSRIARTANPNVKAPGYGLRKRNPNNRRRNAANRDNFRRKTSR